MNKIVMLTKWRERERSRYSGREAMIKARKAGLDLARRLGDGWKVEVWENLGWHYKARSPCGRLQVHESVYDGKVYGYTAYLNEADKTGGIWAESGKTPQLAVVKTVNAAKKNIAFYQSLVKGL